MTVQPPPVVQNSGQVLPAGHEPANLGDILERVLDRGIVIAGDIRVSLLDIELLTLKLRLVIASVDTARQIGIDWWEHDPWLSSRARPPVEPGPRDPEQVEAERRPRVARRAARREEWDEFDG
ncbi:gas vesicle protein GvpJ [Micromonospora sp. NPDC004336]